MNYNELFLATLPETVLELAALLVLIVDLGLVRNAGPRYRAVVAAFFGVAGCAVALWAVSIAPALHFGSTLLLTVGGTAGVAQCSILILTGITLLLLVDCVFSRNPGEYVAVVLMAAAGGLLIAAAQDLLVIFTGLELLSVSLYILAAFAKKSAASAESSLKYYLFGGMAAAFLLFGFSYLYGLSASTSLPQVVLGVSVASLNGGVALVSVALVMIAVGLGFKVAAVPFHFWAPDTYEGAPAPAAAFIASVSKVASFALLISIGTALVPGHGAAQSWSLILAVLAAASMIFGNVAALAQTSVRRLVAYSAIAHAGYILLGLAYFEPSGRNAQAILYYILTYGLTTIGAFGVISAVERATGNDSIGNFAGLHRRNPVLAAVLLVLFLSLAGIPPLVGFWAKFNLFAAVLMVGGGAAPFALVALAVAFSAVSLFYYLQVLKSAYVAAPAAETKIKAGPVTMLVLIVIALAVLGCGCFPAYLQDWIAGFYL